MLPSAGLIAPLVSTRACAGRHRDCDAGKRLVTRLQECCATPWLSVCSERSAANHLRKACLPRIGSRPGRSPDRQTDGTCRQLAPPHYCTNRKGSWAQRLAKISGGSAEPDVETSTEGSPPDPQEDVCLSQSDWPFDTGHGARASRISPTPRRRERAGQRSL